MPTSDMPLSEVLLRASVTGWGVAFLLYVAVRWWQRRLRRRPARAEGGAAPDLAVWRGLAADQQAAYDQAVLDAAEAAAVQAAAQRAAVEDTAAWLRAARSRRDRP